MRFLVIVRHGERAFGEDCLDDDGRLQMSNMATALSQWFSDKVRRIAVLTSTRERAVEGALMISEALGTAAEGYDVLWSEVGRPPQIDRALGLIKSKSSCELVIVVTHLEYCDQLPDAIGRELGADLSGELRELPKGAAIIIDYETKDRAEIRENPSFR